MILTLKNSKLINKHQLKLQLNYIYYLLDSYTSVKYFQLQSSNNKKEDVARTAIYIQRIW
jgi:hypothetical protein